MGIAAGMDEAIVSRRYNTAAAEAAVGGGDRLVLIFYLTPKPSPASRG